LAQRPDVRETEIARMLGAQWMRMSADEKAAWNPRRYRLVCRQIRKHAMGASGSQEGSAEPCGVPPPPQPSGCLAPCYSGELPGGISPPPQPSRRLAPCCSRELPCRISPPPQPSGCLPRCDSSELPCRISPPPRRSVCLARCDSSELPCGRSDSSRELSDFLENVCVRNASQLLRELP
jgi:hypothetical protein